MMGAVVSAPRSRSGAGLVAAKGGNHPAFAGPPRLKAWQGTGGNTKPFHAGTILWRPLKHSFWHLRKDLIREVVYPTRRN